MTSNGFEPFEIVVDSDSAVVFENADVKDHWPASNFHPTHDLYPEFDPKKPISAGESWEFQPSMTGTFRFHDHLFPEFNGNLVVAPKAKSFIDSLVEELGKFLAGLFLPFRQDPQARSSVLAGGAGFDLTEAAAEVEQKGLLRSRDAGEDSGEYLVSQMDACFSTGGKDSCYEDLA
ncbi:MAG TPA: hypothetical protein VJI67_03960, partial [archaeon]|nr:hypothetical protein [archaeon]